ncbi:pseudouridine synthase family protein [Candidatus Margulisiibacteriota bacterium]
MYNNAKKYFITAKRTCSVHDLLQENLQQDIPVQLVIEAGGVWLDKKKISSANIRIEKDQTVRVYVSETQLKSFVLFPDRIVADNNNFMIVYKPPGITTTADRASMIWNLTYGVKNYYLNKGISYDPTPINRIDYMVQGLVLYAKNKLVERHLFKAMADRKIMKVYLALLEKTGDYSPKYLRTKDKLSFTNKAFTADAGKVAESLFILRKQYEAVDAYSVVIFTGRRHQIRFHASRYLRPILGDDYYGSRIKTEGRVIGLFAYGLNFTYQGKRYRIRLHDLDIQALSFINKSSVARSKEC